MTDEYELLGPAEKEIAKQIRNAVAAVLGGATKLIDSLNEIDLNDIELVLLDSKSKEGAVAIAGPLQQLAKNLADAQLAVLIAGIVLKPRKEKASA